nr:porin [Burkholderia sp. WAC0059]
MKYIAFGMGLVCLFTVSSPAFSQSSVSLFGIIDAGLNYVSSAQTGRSGGGALSGGR